ncbi:Pre-mRNA-splicing factor slt-11 [Colletotrichum sidae]|nr:Pre-mRNA-splicing factor slt-11 [Colletotrichum sidae]
MVAPGPSSDINREYFAQNNERAIEEGSAGVEEYEKTDDKARELLRRLAASKPYFRKGRGVGSTEDDSQGGISSSRAARPSGNPAIGAGVGGPGPIRTRDSRAAAALGVRPGRSKQAFPSPAQLPPGPQDWLPPADIHVMSLFVTGVEDDLPEHKIREFFKVHGKIKSLVCSHMSHCAFVNYETREAAEKAAMACQGRAVIAGCPLRVRWGMPKAIGTMDKEQRSQVLTDARRSHGLGRSSGGLMAGQKQITSGSRTGDAATEPTIALPPGADNGPQYASLSGD